MSSNLHKVMSTTMKHVCVAISGASGFIYAQRLVEVLLSQKLVVHLLVSDAAREVARLEQGIEISGESEAIHDYFMGVVAGKLQGELKVWTKTDWLSPVASGSHPLEAMVICPCSTGTLAAVATGMSNNLIERAATVCLKEQRKLIMVPREMPMGTIQFEHMHKLSSLGVAVMPASPGFYHQPKTIEDLIDFVVARILMQMGFEQELLPAWGG